jgi:formylglycine-generating enzyme required for sulfatase activity
MVGLPGGTFTMGGDTRPFETPFYRHDAVDVQGFCLDVTEVTVAAYTSCVSANACTEPAADVWCNWKRPGAGLHPVNCVDWSQATSFCASLGKRLPTEEEWEWAARGTSQARTYPWGDELPSVDRTNGCGTECVAYDKTFGGADTRALYPADDGWPHTAPVGSFPRGATAQGLQDMAGNVWEWTSSSDDANSRVLRGGGWHCESPPCMRAAYRWGFTPTLRSNSGESYVSSTGAYIGLRCAR